MGTTVAPPVSSKPQPFDPALGGLSMFAPAGTGPGYTTSNTPAPVPAAPAFSLPNPFLTDLPAGVKQQFFATAVTAAILAALLGGKPRQETGSNPGAGPNAWFVDFFAPDGTFRMTWNAGDLYLYYQTHAGFVVNT